MTVELNSGINVVDVWASWCVPCKALAEVIKEASTERTDINWLEVEAEASDENMEFCRTYGVMAFPTVLVFNGEDHIGTLTGAMSKEKLLEGIDEIVERI